MRLPLLRRTLIYSGAVLLSSGLSGSAMAASISQTLGEVSFDGNAPFPGAEQTIGSYSYSLPSGEKIIAATISGTFGNSAFSDSSAAVDVFLDDLRVAQCLFGEACWQDSTGIQAWSFSFDTSNFDLLDDGLATLTFVQQSENIVRLGDTTLNVETEAIPTPALLPGLIGMGLAVSRKRQKQGQELQVV